MVNKVILRGSRVNTSILSLSGLKKIKGYRNIPPYFTIEVDLDTIKPREKRK